MANDLTVDFGFGGNGTDHRGTGWAEPEGTGAWMLGQQSLLVLPRPQAEGDHKLALDVGALTGPGHASQRLSVGANGVVLGEFVLLDEGVVECMLPWSVIGREPGLTLVLSHPDAWKPSELTGGEGDQRELSVFLRSARLSLHEAAPAPVPPARPAPAAAAATAPTPPAPPPPAPPAPKPPAPPPAAAAPPAPRPPAQTAARPSAPAPQAAPPPALRPTPAPAATRPTAPAQEARVPWWKKLLG